MPDDRLPFGSVKECPKCGASVQTDRKIIEQTNEYGETVRVSSVHYFPYFAAEPYKITCRNARFVHKVWSWWRMKFTGKDHFVCKPDCPVCMGKAEVKAIRPECLARLDRVCGCGYFWREKPKDEDAKRASAARPEAE